MEWVIDGMDYWCNPNCPREYLERALVDLVSGVEGVSLEESYVEKLTEQELRKEVSHYEYVSDK
ncbi:hypothetical protein MKY34_16860 [Sporosarcina sp. FSL K6-1522]|uniref:hypothetical protein n=1 Tax=Sporosarcina sp. FSL K6-1522 TaxID=2921554 RepID=UPI00315B0358